MSARNPCSSGIMAPPTIARQRMPEPWLVCFPSFATARLKMVGNIIELHRPTKRIAHIAVAPLLNTATNTSALAAKVII